METDDELLARLRAALHRIQAAERSVNEAFPLLTGEATAPLWSKTQGAWSALTRAGDALRDRIWRLRNPER